MKGTNPTNMWERIFQAVGTTTAKALRWYHAHCVHDQQGGWCRWDGGSNEKSDRRRAERSLSGKVWWTTETTLDLLQVRRDTKRGLEQNRSITQSIFLRDQVAGCRIHHGREAAAYIECFCRSPGKRWCSLDSGCGGQRVRSGWILDLLQNQCQQIC